jgi:hypothetical protein
MSKIKELIKHRELRDKRATLNTLFDKVQKVHCTHEEYWYSFDKSTFPADLANYVDIDEEWAIIKMRHGKLAIDKIDRDGEEKITLDEVEGYLPENYSLWQANEAFDHFLEGYIGDERSAVKEFIKENADVKLADIIKHTGGVEGWARIEDLACYGDDSFVVMDDTDRVIAEGGEDGFAYLDIKGAEYRTVRLYLANKVKLEELIADIEHEIDMIEE